MTLNKCWETTEIKIDIIVHLLYKFGHVSFVSKVFGAKKKAEIPAKKHTETPGSKPKTYIKVIPSQMFYNYRIIKEKKKERKTKQISKNVPITEKHRPHILLQMNRAVLIPAL